MSSTWTRPFPSESFAAQVKTRQPAFYLDPLAGISATGHPGVEPFGLFVVVPLVFRVERRLRAEQVVFPALFAIMIMPPVRVVFKGDKALSVPDCAGVTVSR